MARLPRNLVPGLAQHVIQRGNNRQPVFFSDRDCRFYLDALREAAAHYECAIHAYVLMTNHVHLLLTPRRGGGLSRTMQSIGRRYVRHINSVYSRSGTLWEGRFKSAVIDSEGYLLTCMRYIELNPVRAGMVAFPCEYRWSSFRTNAQGRPCKLITPHAIYRGLGSSDAACRRAYCGLFEACIDADALDRIRTATQSGGVIGNQRFREQIARTLKRRVETLPHGGDRKSKAFRSQRNSSTLTP